MIQREKTEEKDRQRRMKRERKSKYDRRKESERTCISFMYCCWGPMMLPGRTMRSQPMHYTG